MEMIGLHLLDYMMKAISCDKRKTYNNNIKEFLEQQFPNAQKIEIENTTNFYNLDKQTLEIRIEVKYPPDYNTEETIESRLLKGKNYYYQVHIDFELRTAYFEEIIDHGFISF